MMPESYKPPKKGEINMTDAADVAALKAKVKDLSDNDFAPLPDAGNMLYLDSKDFPELAKEGEGAQVMLVIKGRVKSTSQGQLCVDAFDAAFVHGALPRLGSGERFADLKAKLAGEPGIRNPGALAAWIGARRYGHAKMSGWAAAGRKNAA